MTLATSAAHTTRKAYSDGTVTFVKVGNIPSLQYLLEKAVNYTATSYFYRESNELLIINFQLRFGYSIL